MNISATESSTTPAPAPLGTRWTLGQGPEPWSAIKMMMNFIFLKSKKSSGSQNIRQKAARALRQGRPPGWGALVPGGHRAPQTSQRLQGQSCEYDHNTSSEDEK